MYFWFGTPARCHALSPRCTLFVRMSWYLVWEYTFGMVNFAADGRTCIGLYRVTCLQMGSPRSCELIRILHQLQALLYLLWRPPMSKNLCSKTVYYIWQMTSVKTKNPRFRTCVISIASLPSIWNIASYTYTPYVHISVLVYTCGHYPLTHWFQPLGIPPDHIHCYFAHGGWVSLYSRWLVAMWYMFFGFTWSIHRDKSAHTVFRLRTLASRSRHTTKLHAAGCMSKENVF